MAMTVTSGAELRPGTLRADLKPAPTSPAGIFFVHQNPPGTPVQGVGNGFVAVVALPGEGVKGSPVWEVRESVETPQKVSQAPW